MSDHDREWGVPSSPRVIASNPVSAREERLREAAQAVLDDAAIQDMGRHVVESYGRLAALQQALNDE